MPQAFWINNMAGQQQDVLSAGVLSDPAWKLGRSGSIMPVLFNHLEKLHN